MDFEYSEVSEDEHDRLCIQFYEQNGDDDTGTIPDEEFDRLFDHLAGILKKNGSYSEESGKDSDFSGYRYVDQIPMIQTVVSDELDPNVAVKAGLEAVRNAHRPFATSFDFSHNYLLILPPNRVFGTFPSAKIKQG